MGERGEAKAVLARLVALLKLVPPRAAEAIEVPLWAARAWLDRADRAKDDFSHAVERGKDAEYGAHAARRAFRWAGENSARTAVGYASRLQNGEFIVVPANYGMARQDAPRRAG